MANYNIESTEWTSDSQKCKYSLNIQGIAKMFTDYFSNLHKLQRRYF